MATLDNEIDELYRLPPEQFTTARNELAKRVAAGDKAGVRALRKPSAPAWAVNQLYWRSRRTWDTLIHAAEQLRDAHRSALRGRTVDLRKADAAHREALSRALKETMELVSSTGQHPTAALKEAVMQTLQAVPADVPPGRLDAPLAPAGFGLLEGITPSRAQLRDVEMKPQERPPAKPSRVAETKPTPVDGQAQRRRAQEERQARIEAEKEQKRLQAEAEHQRREEEKRAAEAARDIARLTAAVARARKQEQELRERLDRAARDRENAEKELERARSGRR